MKSPFMSRKFIMGVAGGLILVLNAVLEAKGLPAMNADTLLGFVSLLVSYIFAQGAVDYAASKNPQAVALESFAAPLQPYPAAGQPLTGDQLQQVEAHLAQRGALGVSQGMRLHARGAATHVCQTGATPSEQ